MAEKAKPVTIPIATPPTKSTVKDPAASTSENAPVTAAATENWNATTPDASLIKDSPERSVCWRWVRWMLDLSAVTVAASVGPRAEASANAAARGIEGTMRWRA